MFLRHVTLENFRGIRRLETTLDATTVLIGENGSGKTSFVDAIRACLAVAEPAGEIRFRPQDFFRPPGAASPPPPLRVELGFEEREPGEWTPARREPLERAISRGTGGRAAVRLRATAEWRAADLPARAVCEFLDHKGKAIPGLDVAAHVAALRRLSPCVVLGDRRALAARLGRALEGAAPERAAEAVLEGADPRRAVEQLFERIASLGDEAPDEEVRQGQVAARRLWERLLESRENGVVGDGARLPPRVPGAGALSLGPLLVFGSLLLEGAPGLHPFAEPLIAIEDVEAHLHPSTLGVVWSIISSIPAQKIVSTHSGEMLAVMPLAAIRRFVRRAERVDVYRLDPERMTREETRKLGYHVRARRGGALFARCWVLVEGETEFWLIPELARRLGYDFPSEGIACVEFSQCGVTPIVKLARHLGIAWHLVSDGDAAGIAYASAARAMLSGEPLADHVTRLPAVDVEHYLWKSGYEEVYLRAAGATFDGDPRRGRRRPQNPRPIISRAIRASSKPSLALDVVEAVDAPDSPGVPEALRHVVETAVRLARG
jgi:putative ATP-dependent endonuclease of OLD family